MRNLNKTACVALAITISTPALAGYDTTSPPVTLGHYTDLDTRMVCGDMTSAYGTGHAFSRETYGGVYKIGVTKYATSTAGVSSLTTAHILNRKYLDFTVIGADPFVGTNPALKNRNYIFGGNLPSGGSNEFFKYDSSGFSGPSLMGGGLISGRAGMIGTPVGNNGIFLFGGYSGAAGSGPVVKESFLFDRVSETFTPLEPMPIGLQNAKALPSGAPISGGWGVSWVYVVGGSTVTGSQSDNRKIYRYDIAANKWIVLQDGAGNDLQIPGTRTMEIASVQGAMLVLTQSEDDGSMIAYRVTHPSTVTYGPGPSGTLAALGAGKGASIATTSYNVPLRARGGFALLRCSPDAWVIGGTYGHGPSFSDRSKVVDKLTRY
jgi:hypothetical protein